MIKINRNTRQKEILNKEIEEINSFFTANEILKKAKKKDSKLGIATVYRFLKNLTDKRKIHSYTCNRRTIYSIHNKNHCHFICEKCKNLNHIEIKSVDFLKNKVNGSVCHFQIDVSGICEKCMKRENIFNNT